MTTAVFTPRHDGPPFWQTLYEELTRRLGDGSVELGTVLTHEDLHAVIDEARDAAYYGAIQRAARRLEKTHKRTLRVERGVGYAVIAGGDQVQFGLQHQGRARSALRRGQQLIKSADRALMSAGEARAADAALIGITALVRVANMTVEKLADHEVLLSRLHSSQAASQAKQQATEDDIAEMRAQIAAMRADMAVPQP